MKCHSSSLTVWTADIEAHVLSSAIEQFYNAFFYSTSTHLLCQQSDEVLFGHFMSTLNAAFKSKLALEEEGYESGSENFNIPTPLRRTSKIHHIYSVENAFFDWVTPCSTGTRQSHCRPVWWHLTFSSSRDEDTPTDEIPLPASTAPLQNHIDTLQHPSSKCTLNAYVKLEEEEDEDFQDVSLDNEHWNTEEILDRLLCIHEHSILHELCQYPCPYLDYTSSSYYDTLDLSDISEFEDLMATSSNEDIPALDEVGYWNLWTVVRNEHLHFISA